MQQIDLGRCWLYANKSGTYARHQRVFPFYDKIVAMARKKLFDEENKVFSNPVKVNGDTYYITQKTAKSYRNAFDVYPFTQKCIEHIKTNIENGEIDEDNESVMTCPAMTLELKEGEITSVQINIRSYRSPNKN